MFGALAAFTKDFDVGFKLVEDLFQQSVTETQQLRNFTSAEIGAVQFRQDRLAILNAKGISVVMFLGRVLLLIQYILGETKIIL